VGRAWFAEFGIDTDAVATERRSFCRPCLDWGERRDHLGGALGKALLERLVALGWARRADDSRIMLFTPRGELAWRALWREPVNIAASAALSSPIGLASV
jgi:hypothetical protein